MEDELLQELDSLLKPAIEQAWSSAKRVSGDTDPRGAFLDLMQVQIDNTRVALSDTLYKIDLATKKNKRFSVERAATEHNQNFNLTESDFPEIDTSKYVKETTDGYEVWDGMRWVKLSKQSDFKVEIFQDPLNDGKPAVRVWALDTTTKTEVLYVDNDIPAPGWDLSMTRTGDFEDSLADFVVKDQYWEDPFYRIAKNSRAIGSATTGVLAMRHIGNLTPWNAGDGLRNANGWYRNREGILQKLSQQRGKGAGGYQKSARNAAKKAKVFKSAGKVLLVASVAFSGYEIIDASVNDYTNKGEVITKASVDITISLIGAFGGPVGWAIAGTYFILNVSGAFGDWGTPSGISQKDYNIHRMKQLRQKYGNQIKSLEFDIDYVPRNESMYMDDLMEERRIKRDNTRVAMPKLLLKRQ